MNTRNIRETDTCPKCGWFPCRCGEQASRKGPLPHARLDALEKTVDALKMIVEKQNETITALTARVDLLDPHVPAKTPEYVPQFTQWPGNGR